MASLPPTISEASAKRPWFKKKRYLIPMGLAVLLGFIGSLGDSSSIESPEGEAEQVRQTFEEGIMPNFVGFTPGEVFDSLEVLDVASRDVRWPEAFRAFGATTRDADDPSEWPADADDWTVCDQKLPPGAEIENQFVWDIILYWGKGCADFRVVPDFVGLDGKSATELSWARGIQLDGVSEFDADRDVCEQTPVAGDSPAQSEDGWVTVDVTSAENCDVLFAERAEREARVKELEQEEEERAERQRILDDPNTFEGGRRFINYHSDLLSNDIALIDQYRRWLEAGAVIDDPDSFGGPLLDALFGDIPSLPRIAEYMREEAPDGYQEQWDDIRQRLDEADEAHDEALRLRAEGVYSIAEELPYVADVRVLTVEALRLVESIPYPQQ